MNTPNAPQQGLLRIALLGNATFSTISALIILTAGPWVLRILGLSADNSLSALGVGLLVFAGLLVWSARRQTIKVTDAWIAVFMDLAWVLGSCALLFVAPFSTGGKWLVAMVADLVLVFAILQWLGIRKIKKTAQFV